MSGSPDIGRTTQKLNVQPGRAGRTGYSDTGFLKPNCAQLLSLLAFFTQC